MTSALFFIKVQGEKSCSGIKLINMCDVSTKIPVHFFYHILKISSFLNIACMLKGTVAREFFWN